MSKILLCSDIHIHPHKRSSERLQDCIDCLDWIFQTAIEREIKDVIFLGDLFHDRQKIDILTYQKTFDVFKKYLINKSDQYLFDHPEPAIINSAVAVFPNFRTWLLLGNHDLWHFQKWDVSSCHPLGAIAGVTIIDKPLVFKVSEHPIAFLPYTNNPIEDLKSLEILVNEFPKHNRILCGHLAIDNALWNTKHQIFSEVSVEHDGDMVKFDPSYLDSWDQVFLGHYHAAQEINGFIEYVGSPLQLSFGETEQKKHILIYDLDTKEKEYVENQFSPKHYIIDEKNLNSHDLKDQFVRFFVDDMSAASVIETQKKLVEDGVRSLQIQQKPKIDEHVVKDAKAILYKREEMLDQYLNQVDLEELSKKKLLDIGRKICTA
jgi:DNA repair exonuclease SbcCD nuclease subunit